MKKITKSIVPLVIVVILILGAGYINNKNKNVNTSSSIKNSQGNDIYMEPDEIVDLYMYFTLGSIPNASVDYDTAKQYLTYDLRTQFTNPMFVPTSYCIQDGPDDVRIVSNKSVAGNGEIVEIVVEGQYDGVWQEMWQFSLIPKGDMAWLISEIKCLNE